MGIFTSTPKRNIKVIVQGLQRSGKKTIMHKLQFDRGTRLIPRGDGSYISQMQYRNVTFLVCDVTHHTSQGDPYVDTYPNTDAFMFVVDSHDRSTLDIARDALHQTLQHELLEDTPVVVLSNKSDIENSLSHLEMTEQLQLYKLSQNCSLFSTSGDDGTGLYEALDWLSDALNTKNMNKSYLASVRQFGHQTWTQITNYFR